MSNSLSVSNTVSKDLKLYHLNIFSLIRLDKQKPYHAAPCLPTPPPRDCTCMIGQLAWTGQVESGHGCFKSCQSCVFGDA
jgi:hypothetical protein